MYELVARFHSLQGNNLQEVKRTFNELLGAIQRGVPLQDLDSLVTSINPKTKLESVLKVEILIYFKRYDALLDILKSGNSMLIGKVLKCWTFFEVVFSKIDALTLVNQIFPHTSFSVRMKIITKLSMNLKNEELADGYFHAIEDKYGLFVAKGLLPVCSLDLIKSTVASYNINLTSRQLTRIVKRDREFLGYYFSVLHQAYGEDFDLSKKYSEVLRYLAKVDEQLFWKLFKKYKLKVKFGRRVTPKLYERGKDVVTTSDYKQRIFNLRKIYKIIRKSDVDLHKFILELYPKRAENFNAEYAGYCLKTLIGYLPKNKKYDVVNSCFEEAYGRGISEFLTVDFSEDLLQFIPVQERELFIDGQLVQDESLIFMYPTKKSIPLLHERIKYTSNIRKRSELTVLLCKTCRFNEDTEGLLEVLKYMHLRHKNDKFILIDFLISLYAWEDTKNFNRDHWDLIFELLKLVMPSRKLFNYGTTLMKRYLKYAVVNKLPCDEFMRAFLKYVKAEGGYFDSLFDSVECAKFYYESFAQLLPQMYQGDDFFQLSCSLLSTITHFNVRHPNNKIDIFGYPELISAVKIQLNKLCSFYAEPVVKYCVKFERDDEYDQIYWENFEKMHDNNIVIWYLRNKPGKVLEHISEVLTPRSIHQLNYKLHKVLKLMSLLSFKSIPEKVIGFALDGIHHEDPKVVKFSAAALSYLMKEEDYLEIMKTFVPTSDGKVDLNTMPQSYVAAQEGLIKGLSNFSNPISSVPPLLKFCTGDYMKYAMGPLYRIANRIPESKLRDFLNSLYQSSVSVRKHAVYLTTSLEQKERVYNFLKVHGVRDKHASMQKLILKSILWSFASNPSQEFWDLLKCNIKIIHENDHEAFACLVNLCKIPIKYLPKYIPIVYEILTKNSYKEIAAKKYDLLASVRNNLINKIDVSFLKYAIRDTVLQPDSGQESDFYLKSVFYTTSEKQMDILSVILDVLKTYVRKNWGSFVYGKARMDVYKIVRDFCLRAIKINADNVLVEKSLQFWTLNIKKGELLEEYLLLQLTNAYLGCSSEGKLREFGVKVSETLAECVGLYGPSVIPVFAEELINFFKEFLTFTADNEKQMEFFDGLLLANGNDFSYVLASNVMFGLVPWDSMDQFNSVLETMRLSESVVVQIHLHRLLKRR